MNSFIVWTQNPFWTPIKHLNSWTVATDLRCLMTLSFAFNLHMDKPNSMNVLKYIYGISLWKRRFTYNNLWPCVKNVNTWLVPQRSWRLCRFNIWLIWKTMLCCYASQSAIQAQLKVFFSLCIKLQAGVRSSFSDVLLPLQHWPSTHPHFICVTLVQTVPKAFLV